MCPIYEVRSNEYELLYNIKLKFKVISVSDIKHFPPKNPGVINILAISKHVFMNVIHISGLYFFNKDIQLLVSIKDLKALVK